MQKIKLLVVLYKKLPQESETILSLSKIKKEISKNIEVYIWDNSPIITDSTKSLKDLLSPIKFTYHADGINTPLSSIYNTIIKTELNDSDILIIFDHDSSFGIRYFDTLSLALANEKNINLFLPIIKYNNHIVSPGNLWYFKGSYWKKKHCGKIDSKHKTAINSGMAIRANYLKKKFKGYNENILFYGTDDDFMKKYSINNKYFYVIDTEISHILNFFENNDIEDKVKRYTAIREANLRIMKQEGKLIYLIAQIYFFINSCKFALKNKKIKFIKNT